tara:strand:- start:164 stop:580 length:417 start_codon:yes stop_codon:yes gene_type:complete
MKKLESKLYLEIKKALPNVHFQRIETNVGLGVPDVNGCYKGIDFWLELKVSSGTRINLSKYQKSWIIRRGRAGGRVFILQKALLERALKLYQWTSAMVREPSTPVPFAKFPFPVDYNKLLKAILQSPSAQPGTVQLDL